MSGGGSSKTVQSNELPPELRPLYAESSSRMLSLQNRAPLTEFTSPSPLRVAPRTALQQRAAAEVPGLFELAQRRVTGEALPRSPSLAAARQAFTTAIQPRVENTAALAGLGRSTALSNALAQAEAQYLLPVIEGELAREERGLEREGQMRLSAIQAAEGIGAAERAAQQDVYSAEHEDRLRRQAIAEQALFQPFGLLAPSSISQRSSTSGSSGLFK